MKLQVLLQRATRSFSAMPVRPADVAERRPNHKLSPAALACLGQILRAGCCGQRRTPEFLVYVSDHVTHRDFLFVHMASNIPNLSRASPNKSNGLPTYLHGAGTVAEQELLS